MANACLAIRLPLWASADAAELPLKMAFAIHAAGCKLCIKSKNKKRALLYANIPVDKNMLNVSMGRRTFEKKKSQAHMSL